MRETVEGWTPAAWATSCRRDGAAGFLGIRLPHAVRTRRWHRTPLRFYTLLTTAAYTTRFLDKRLLIQTFAHYRMSAYQDSFGRKGGTMTAGMDGGSGLPERAHVSVGAEAAP